MTRLILPEDGAEFDLMTLHQRAFSGQWKKNIVPTDWLHPERREGEDYTFPVNPICLWESDEAEDVLELSENEAFDHPIVIKTAEKSAALRNLRIGTRYYWRVNGSESRSLTTEVAPPRWIHAEGVSNVRDLGGWRNAEGRRIRQGLIFRGSEMDTHHAITEQGISTLRDELHIRTDLDLRGEAVGRIKESPLGADIRFCLIPVKAYGEFFEDDQKEACRKVFSVLADETNYPVYFHCWGGADRTGTVSFLLHAILGVEFEKLCLDYELTSLSIWGDRSRKSDLFVSLLAALDKYGEAGGDVRTKAENFLLSCGIAAEDLDKLRKNLLEEQKGGF